MKHFALFAGAAAIAFSGPAFAKHGNGHGRGHDYSFGYSYGSRGCPPGLAKKSNGCLPPGQAKKLYRGAHFPSGFGTRYSYRQIPYDVRHRYSLDPYDRYYYSNGYLYRVDPRTMLVEQIVSALLNR